jgi:tetratricopeptide (TPR) repeat protein
LNHTQGRAAQELVRAIDLEIRSRGRGSIRAVDRATDHSEGWWQHRAASQDITVQQLLTVLDPVRFLRRTLGGESPLELDKPRGTPPEIVTKAWQRIHSGEEGKGIGETYLETLDQQRYQEPAKVVRLALWAMDHVELHLLPRLLGIAGSAWRRLLKLNEAEHALFAGFEIALGQDAHATMGELLQRLSYVFANRGEYREALRIADKAVVILAQAEDFVGLGKLFVTIGSLQGMMGAYKASIAAFEAALKYLPEDSLLDRRFAALHGLGESYREMGRLDEALDWAQQAQSLVDAVSKLDAAKLLLLEGALWLDLGEFDLAESRLCRAVEQFSTLSPVDAALAMTVLVRTQLLKGETGPAYQTVEGMLKLLEPLRQNKVVSAAIADLFRCGQAGLTLAVVEDAQEIIEKARGRHQS